ncbi:MAG: histone deacetylase [Acidobacteriota bacterium]
MRAYYCDHFVLPLPDRHRFPMRKYRQLREAVVADGVVDRDDLRVPEAAARDDLLRAHDADYVARVFAGTLAACRAARRDGCAVNLAGGTHHAGPDHGEGFCVFNDAAVAARTLQANGEATQVLIVDCDVHQGNGTASIFRDDPSVFTLSLHGRRNFPFRKSTSDLDVAFEDDTGDDVYLAALDDALDQALTRAAADLVIYIAGADPFAGDRLGRLALSKAGLAARDRRVIDRCRDADLPVAVAMAGGYAPDIQDIVDIHLATVRAARRRAR